MRALAVISEAFAVIAGSDDERPPHQIARVQPVEDAGNLRIGIRDLAVVR
jgi:hypothetical protein